MFGKSTLSIQRPLHRIVLITILLLLLLGTFTVMLHSVLSTNPLGPDFFTFWLAGRAVFVQGQNPYSAEVTLQSQTGIYGRPALPQEDQVAFAYPPFSLLLILPAVFMPFEWAQSFWLALNIVSLVSVLFILGRKRPPGFSLSLFLFYPLVFGLLLGNFAVPIAVFLLALYVFILERELPSTAAQVGFGFLLAWTTTKPQFIWLLLGFIILLAIRKRLFPLLGGFAPGLVFFWGISFLLVPTWLLDWLHRLQEYAGYVQSQPVLTGLFSILLPSNLSGILTLLSAAACVVFSIFLLRRWWTGNLPALPVLAWFGFLTYLFHPHGIAYEQLCFLVPLTLWVNREKNKHSMSVILFWFGAALFSWGIFILSKWVYHPADPLPVLLNGIWVFWLLKSQWKNTQPLVEVTI
jgi:hypothetical protein